MLHYEQNSISSGAGELRVPLLHSVSAQTPWWLVSCLFHVFVIALVGMVSITINLDEDNALVMTTALPRVAEPKPERVSRVLVPATYCPNSREIEVVDLCGDPLKLSPREITFSGLDNGIRELPDAPVRFASTTLNPGEELPDLIGPSMGWGGDGMIPGGGATSAEEAGYWGRRTVWCSGIVCILRKTPQGLCLCYCRGKLPNARNWLAANQEDDGHWDAVKHGAAQKNDTAVTSFALLAFLSFGESEKIGDHKENVQRAVKWLIDSQKADGSFADDEENGAPNRRGGYPNAIATLALCEAAGMASVPSTCAAAQKAVDYCMNGHQAGSGAEKSGWRYAPKAEGDLSVTGWTILALKSAKVSGLRVDPAAFDGAQRFLESVEIKDKNREDGTVVSHFKYTAGNEQASSAHRLTAIGTVSRVLMGWKPEELKGSVEWFMDKGGLPEWGANGAKADLYYWYFGALAVHRQDFSMCRKWDTAMKNALLPNQCGDGSWNPAGAYSSEWGRVGQTALSALCLEKYFSRAQE